MNCLRDMGLSWYSVSMDTFFSPFDPAYAALAFSAVLLDAFFLRRVLPLKVWCLLRLPSTFLHELAHLLTALLFGGRAWMTVIPKVEADGSITLGRTEWDGVGMGFIGKTAVAAAPIAWLLTGVIMARVTLSQPHTLLEGLGWLAACMAVVGAGLRVSASDLANMDWFTRIYVLAHLFVFVGLAAFEIPAAGCHWFGMGCP